MGKKVWHHRLVFIGILSLQDPRAKWACWARHIDLIRFQPDGLPLYKELRNLVGDRPYFVITTNVEKQFEKGGFAPDNIFEVQGDYGLMQCSRGCHEKVYDNERMVKQMVGEIEDCKVPSSLVPYCPVCGAPMEVHVRKDGYFIETEEWRSAADRYENFISLLPKYKNVVLLELGVGFNTPTIIRYPFERIAAELPNATLIRINNSPLDIKGFPAKKIFLVGNIQNILKELK